MEGAEELPLTVYETLDAPETAGGGGGAVFVDADFELETYEPERIAVEKVFKTQPSQTAAAASAAAKGRMVSGSSVWVASRSQNISVWKTPRDANGCA